MKFDRYWQRNLTLYVSGMGQEHFWKTLRRETWAAWQELILTQDFSFFGCGMIRPPVSWEIV